MKTVGLFSVLLLCSLGLIAQDCKNKHWYRGNGFLETANYMAACNSYNEALKIAPNCPDIYYNKALSCEGLCIENPQYCDTAIACYKKYIELEPYASDKDEVQGRIYATEAKKESYQQIYEKKMKTVKELLGDWYVQSDYMSNPIWPLEYITVQINNEGVPYSKVQVFKKTKYWLTHDYSSKKLKTYKQDPVETKEEIIYWDKENDGSFSLKYTYRDEQTTVWTYWRTRHATLKYAFTFQNGVMNMIRYNSYYVESNDPEDNEGSKSWEVEYTFERK
jgi:tetratricopeptide (TPR) repeat protein